MCSWRVPRRDAGGTRVTRAKTSESAGHQHRKGDDEKTPRKSPIKKAEERATAISRSRGRDHEVAVATRGPNARVRCVRRLDGGFRHRSIGTLVTSAEPRGRERRFPESLSLSAFFAL